MAAEDENDVEYTVLYKPLPLLVHGYVLPFIVLYVGILIGWIVVFGNFEHFEALMICIATIASLNIITCLSCVWSVHIRCLLTCKKVSSISDAVNVKVVPTPNNGSTELVKVQRKIVVDSGQEVISFMFQNIKYIYDNERKQFKQVDFPIDFSIQYYQEQKGFLNHDEITSTEQKFGLNKLSIILPDFWMLFKERATAPFFVFQVFCVGLWCLDEYWYYSLFTLFMLVIFEALLVQQVYREGRWSKLSTEKLLPGDIVSLGRSRDGQLVPCDILLLRGSCIVDESMLTGESIPQMKEPCDATFHNNNVLDITKDGKLHVMYGGTKVVQHTPPSRLTSGFKPPDNGCIGYVLRTGFNTSQGKLLRTILFGVKRVTANNLETFMFILFLLMFAITAASYVWIKGTENPECNRYKLFLECTLILTSVVPPELPIELSLAVNTSLISLAKIGVYCTEPFRIPFGGKVDVCCFDKTGTLTSDNLVVRGIAGLSGHNITDDQEQSKTDFVPASEAPLESQYVLASCHSLTLLDGEMVGDPLEKAAIQAAGWRISKADTATPVKGQKISLHICSRFHFSSSLRRMSTVSSLTSPSQTSPTYIACVKGAPEIIKTMLQDIPDYYDSLYLKLARRGSRVLALGYCKLGNLSMKEVGSLTRENIERNLTFAGFIALSCPLKKYSEDCVQQLKDSSHHVIMITGDNPLTACHVAKQLKITTQKILLLQSPADLSGDWYWESVNASVKRAIDTNPSAIKELGHQFDLCLTGDGVSYLLQTQTDFKLFNYVLPYVKIFARVSPKQKEQIITSLKSLGYYTLMCGDGTNDVGALKHAHVGVSLLSTVKLKPSNEEKKPGVSLQSRPLQPRPSLHSVRPKTVNEKQSSTNASTHGVQRSKLLADFLKQSEDALKDPSLVRLGDASIASPFTSRESNIKCICHVIKQGRCTLVTTLQMFKILAINALILAYSQSVLYLDGIKFSDTQATIQGILLAGCFLFISRSKPLDTLSKLRPLPNIFNLYTILTVTCQFAIHLWCLLYLVKEARLISPSTEEFVDLEKEFEQTIVNSSVYLISIAMQISNFAVNYKGHPFMVGLTENKPLLYSLIMAGSMVMLLASGAFPSLCVWLEIVEFPSEFQTKVMLVLIGDFISTYATDAILSYLLGTTKLRQP